VKILLDECKSNTPYFSEENFVLFLADSLHFLKNISSNSIDMVFADPPYFLSNDGITCQSGKMISVNKGEWDKSEGVQAKHEFNRQWLKECKRILKPNGTIWVSGTFHNIYSVGFALEELDYKIINNITWYKPNASPNLSCRYFTHSTETILWAKKSAKAKHIYHYQVMKHMNNNKQMRDVWEIPTTKKSEKRFGKHPTQKPLALLERIILASTNEGDVILDPFNGSGTTGIAANRLNRKYIGIDNVEEYLKITIERYKYETYQPSFLFG
jgi:site-specific DNA-methyltransferase (adenine-specific)